MYPSTSELHLYNRRLLLHSPPPPPSSPTTTQTDVTSHDSTYATSNGFNANVIMVLSVLLCALFCSLGINSLIRCTIRCSAFFSRTPTEDGDDRGVSSPAALAKVGVNKKALKTFPTVSFSAEVGKVSGLDSECVICLSEFVAGEKVRLLPKCNHGFHVRCIDKWLGSHSSCPTCRCCLVVGQVAASSSAQPLEREDMIHT